MKKSRKLIIVSILLLSLYGVSFSRGLQIPLLWKADLNTLLESAPTVADLNNDGRDEVVIAGMEDIFVLNKNGKQLWRWHTRKRYSTYPCVLPRSKKPALIYAADNSGLFTCLDGNGKKIWQRELDGPSAWSAAAIYKMPLDKAPRVIQTDQTGAVWCFNAFNGRMIWKTRISGKPASPAIGDLDGDGRAEVVLKTNDGTLVALSISGKVLWREKIGGNCEDWATASPVIFIASDGKARIAAASSDGELFVTNGNGDVLWSYPTGQPVASTISVGDFDQDGRADIFFVTQLGMIYRMDESGAVLWQINMQGRSLAPGAILDINNDGQLEYVLCTQRGHMLILNQFASIIFDYQFDNRTINVTPSFGNVSGERGKLEFVITGGESGRVFCFETPAFVGAAQQWIAYRANPQNTGVWFGLVQSQTLRMIPQNLDWNRLLIGDRVRFRIVNPYPQHKPLKATAVCIQSNGKRQSAHSLILGKRGDLVLPVNFVVPGTYHFSWWLENEKGKKLILGRRDLPYEPFKNDRALVERAIFALKNTAKVISGTLPLSAEALRLRLNKLEIQSKELHPLQDAIPASSAEPTQEILKKTCLLNKQAKRALKISEVIRQALALGAGTSLIAFEGKLWDNRDVCQQLPSQAANPLQIVHDVVPGEHQPVSLMIFNMTNRALNVRLKTHSIDKGLRLSLLHSIAVPTSLGEMSWDPLPALDESGVVSVPPLESREFWLDVQVDHQSKGTRRIQLDVLALNGSGVLEAPGNPHAVPSPATRVNIQLNVLPFKMAPSGAFRLCTWSPSEGPDIPDLLSHANNVFIVPHGKMKSDSSKKGNSIDFSRLDRIVRQFSGRDVFFLISGFPSLKEDFGNPGYRKSLKNYLSALVNHLKKFGVDTNHFALYPIDEPGGHGWNAVNKLVDFGKMAHDADPNIKIYMDGGGDVPMLKKMAEVVDICTPPIDWLGQDSPEMRVIRASHKILWSYNCSYSFSRPVGANLKNTNIVGEYRNAALFAFRHGSTGIGFWCYNATRGDLWTRISPEYNLVYPGRTAPVTSRRWEAVREGIEDARILLALKDFEKGNAQNPRAKSVCLKIRKLIEEELPALVDPGFRAMKLGLDRHTLDAKSNGTKVASFRKEMMACVRATVEK